MKMKKTYLIADINNGILAQKKIDPEMRKKDVVTIISFLYALKTGDKVAMFDTSSARRAIEAAGYGIH